MAHILRQRLYAFRLNIASTATAFTGGASLVYDNGYTKSSSVAFTSGHGLGLYLAMRGIIASRNLEILGVAHKSFYLAIASESPDIMEEIEQSISSFDGLGSKVKRTLTFKRASAKLDVMIGEELVVQIELLESLDSSSDVQTQALQMLRVYSEECGTTTSATATAMLSMLSFAHCAKVCASDAPESPRAFASPLVTRRRAGVSPDPQRSPASQAPSVCTPLSPGSRRKTELFEEAIKGLLRLWCELDAGDWVVDRQQLAHKLGVGVWNTPMNEAIKRLRQDPVFGRRLRQVGGRSCQVAHKASPCGGSPNTTTKKKPRKCWQPVSVPSAASAAQ